MNKPNRLLRQTRSQDQNICSRMRQFLKWTLSRRLACQACAIVPPACLWPCAARFRHRDSGDNSLSRRQKYKQCPFWTIIFSGAWSIIEKWPLNLWMMYVGLTNKEKKHPPSMERLFKGHCSKLSSYLPLVNPSLNSKVWNSVEINEMISDPESGYGEHNGPVFKGLLLKYPISPQ